jgi:hypothetical protein
MENPLDRPPLLKINPILSLWNNGFLKGSQVKFKQVFLLKYQSISLASKKRPLYIFEKKSEKLTENCPFSETIFDECCTF